MTVGAVSAIGEDGFGPFSVDTFRKKRYSSASAGDGLVLRQELSDEGRGQASLRAFETAAMRASSR